MPEIQPVANIFMTKKRILIILLILSVVGALALGGAYAGYRGYRNWRQGNLVKQAREFFTKGDVRKAGLSLQRALRYNARDLDACRLMAELSESIRSPGTLLWRSRVVELSPKSLDDRLALVRTAMTMRDLGTATNALEGVPVSDRNSATYHNLAATLAAGLNQPAQAEQHFLEASRLEPGNETLKLNLAVLRLHWTNSPSSAEARTSLRQLSTTGTNAVLRCQALRELAIDAMRNNQIASALAMSQELVQQTNAMFSDRLLRLEILRGTTNAAFTSTLETFKREATNDVAKIFDLAMWQIPRLGPTNTLTWLQTLPPSLQTNQPVTLLIAQCYTATRNWTNLQSTLESQKWTNEVTDVEFLRHAFLTRCLRERGMASGAKTEWEQALRTTQNRKENLMMLLQLTAGWNWESEAEEVLWAIVNRYPNEKRAISALSNAFMATGRTRSLMTLFGKMVKTAPADLGAKNNLAFSALLLEAKELSPHQLAREVYEKAPTNSAFVSTYAYSLIVQEKPKEALLVFGKLNPKDLEQPSIAPYYGLALQAAGEVAKAQPYLALADKAQLLPEEKELFRVARGGK